MPLEDVKAVAFMAHERYCLDENKLVLQANLVAVILPHKINNGHKA